MADTPQAQEVHDVPAVQSPVDPDQVEMPLLEAARQLGDKFWTRVEVGGLTVNGLPTVAVTFDGPSWVTAGIRALKGLDEHFLVTKAQMRAWALEVEGLSIGVHHATEKDRIRPSRRG